jgi:F420-dependent oxidoreductase-like protein
MRFSFWSGNSHPWEEIQRSCVRADETGWDGIWFADHFMPFSEDTSGPVHEAWATLAALAAVTRRARLGPLVVGNTYRNPAVLLKTAATVDHVSGGRLVLGIGAGWQENEHRAYGIEFGSFSERFEKLEESLRILRALRDDGRAELDGRHYTMADAPLSPRPAGPLPILIGGGGERKTLRLVARYAEEWNVWGTPDVLAAKGRVLDEHCEREGRDPDSIQRSAVALLFLCDTEERAAQLRERPIGRPCLIGTPSQLHEQLQAFVDAGVHEVIVPDFTLGEPSAKDDTLDRFLAEVAAPFRS